MKLGGRRILYLAAGVLSLLVVARLAQAFFAQPASDLITFDQASRAEEAVRLAKEVRFLEIPRFLLHLLSLNWWPPLHPLLALPFVLVLGPSLEAAIVPSLVAFVLAVLGLVFLFESLSPQALGERALGTSFLLTLALTSPLLLSSATWVMLEIFGVGLTCFAFGFYLRARRLERPLDYALGSVFVLLLWILKYSYGLFVSLVFVLLEVRRGLPKPPTSKGGREILSRLLRPVFYPAYVLGAILAWIAGGGGIKIQLWGVRVSISNIYNPLLYLYLYLLLVALVFLRKNWAAIKSRLRPGQRELLLYGALPTGLFLALPDKIKAVIKNFEAGHRLPAGPVGNPFSFYARALLQDYALWLPLGIVVLGLFVFAATRLKRAPLGIKALVLFFLLGWASLGAGFRLQESRYLATFVPAVWVAAAWAVERLAHGIPQRVKSALAVVLVLALGLLFVGSPLPVGRAVAQPWAPWVRHSPSVRPVVETIIEGTRETHRLLISGMKETWLEPLLAWKLQMAHSGQRDFRLEFYPQDSARGTLLGSRRRLRPDEAEWIVLFVSREHGLPEWMECLAREGRFRLEKQVDVATPLEGRLIFFRRSDEAALRAAPPISLPRVSASPASVGRRG